MAALGLLAVGVALGGATATAALKLLGWKRPKAAWQPAVHVPTPHPDWKPGEPQPSPHAGSPYVTVDPATYDKASMYALVISMVVPRPIAFVSSIDAEGHVNLAPYSYFNAMCEWMDGGVTAAPSCLVCDQHLPAACDAGTGLHACG